MDVSKLYPSVPKDEGLAACKKALDSRQDPRIPTSEVMKMIKLVLENNNFSLGQTDHYVQTNGTAIGSKLGRNYACTYLGSWEQELFKRCELKPLVYLRFIDDIFGCWLYGEESLKEFHMTANQIHDKIKVDLRHSKTELEFLDVKVRMSGGISQRTYTQSPQTLRRIYTTLQIIQTTPRKPSPQALRCAQKGSAA